MTYRDTEKKYIGSSDIAVLILVGCKDNEGVKTDLLSFGEDGGYSAYIVKDPEIEIGSHYQKVATFNGWLRIYDDEAMTFNCSGKEINLYRAGAFGCIIQII